MSAVQGSASRGGLCRAFEQARSWGEPKPLLCPRPEPALPRGASEPTLSGSRTLTTSATASPVAPCRDDPASMEAGLAELRRLFAAECTLGTSAPGFGVSPPVRTGAANGLVHDSLWRQEAPRACKASLRALHERAGPRCLSSCSGDYRLLMASPDQGLSLLAGAVEREEAGWHPVHCASPEPADLFSY
ncbi:hypothetical protein ABPG77_010842 [Micractinium sp. CCAP 211/92]